MAPISWLDRGRSRRSAFCLTAAPIPTADAAYPPGRARAQLRRPTPSPASIEALTNGQFPDPFGPTPSCPIINVHTSAIAALNQSIDIHIIIGVFLFFLSCSDDVTARGWIVRLCSVARERRRRNRTWPAPPRRRHLACTINKGIQFLFNNSATFLLTFVFFLFFFYYYLFVYFGFAHHVDYVTEAAGNQLSFN